MKKAVYRLAFHKNHKPRGWLRRILFRSNQQPRAMFMRVVFKKNGQLRPIFHPWVSSLRSRAQFSGKVASQDSLAATANIEAVLTGPPSVEELVSNYRHGKVPAILLSGPELAVQLATARGKPLILSVGHDNYRSISGGVQFCIQREEQQAIAKGYDYLNLHPFQPLPRLAHLDDDPDPYVDLVLNGQPIGTASMSILIRAVTEIAHARDINLVLHQLLGHHPEQMIELAKACGIERCFFWLHDFFAICPSYTLQRNNRAFCNAPEIQSSACRICIYGAERIAQLPRIRNLFTALQVHVLAPSQATADLWHSRSGLTPSHFTVVPHVSLMWASKDKCQSPNEVPPYVIGYLGLQVPHKGWPVFEQLASFFNDGKTFRFVNLGEKRPRDRRIRFKFARVTATNVSAMADAVAEEGVDLVVHWPTWPETFSFTTYEAMQGGAYVLTNEISGNVAAAVRSTGRGAILRGEADLNNFFCDGRAASMARAARTARANQSCSRSTSDMTLAFINEA